MHGKLIHVTKSLTNNLYLLASCVKSRNKKVTAKLKLTWYVLSYMLQNPPHTLKLTWYVLSCMLRTHQIKTNM